MAESLWVRSQIKIGAKQSLTEQDCQSPSLSVSACVETMNPPKTPVNLMGQGLQDPWVPWSAGRKTPEEHMGGKEQWVYQQRMNLLLFGAENKSGEGEVRGPEAGEGPTSSRLLLFLVLGDYEHGGDGPPPLWEHTAGQCAESAGDTASGNLELCDPRQGN